MIFGRYTVLPYDNEAAIENSIPNGGLYCSPKGALQSKSPESTEKGSLQQGLASSAPCMANTCRRATHEHSRSQANVNAILVKKIDKIWKVRFVGGKLTHLIYRTNTKLLVHYDEGLTIQTSVSATSLMWQVETNSFTHIDLKIYYQTSNTFNVKSTPWCNSCCCECSAGEHGYNKTRYSGQHSVQLFMQGKCETMSTTKEA